MYNPALSLPVCLSLSFSRKNGVSYRFSFSKVKVVNTVAEKHLSIESCVGNKEVAYLWLNLKVLLHYSGCDAAPSESRYSPLYLAKKKAFFSRSSSRSWLRVVEERLLFRSFLSAIHKTGGYIQSNIKKTSFLAYEGWWLNLCMPRHSIPRYFYYFCCIIQYSFQAQKSLGLKVKWRMSDVAFHFKNVSFSLQKRFWFSHKSDIFISYFSGQEKTLCNFPGFRPRISETPWHTIITIMKLCMHNLTSKKISAKKPSWNPP